MNTDFQIFAALFSDKSVLLGLNRRKRKAEKGTSIEKALTDILHGVLILPRIDLSMILMMMH